MTCRMVSRDNTLTKKRPWLRDQIKVTQPYASFNSGQGLLGYAIGDIESDDLLSSVLKIAGD